MSLTRIKSAFPNLVDGFWRKTSEENTYYNCIAWAAYDQNNWWWPSGNSDDYWPSSAPLEETLAAFIAAYGTCGYVVCSDGSLEPDFEKIAIFAKSQLGTLVPQHAARQLQDGCWTSKLGPHEDIEHVAVSGVEGQEYGSVVTYMKRPLSGL
jgi:hypothetical protein